jgi:enamine deaminase RidA (YjgF/YER057c/UK114 family)
MRTIRSPKVAEAPPQTWSNMKVADGYFHIAGMTGSGAKGEHLGDDMYIQAKSIFQKFKDLLEAAGGKMNDILFYDFVEDRSMVVQTASATGVDPIGDDSPHVDRVRKMFCTCPRERLGYAIKRAERKWVNGAHGANAVVSVRRNRARHAASSGSTSADTDGRARNMSLGYSDDLNACH